MRGRYVDTSRAGFALAMDISAGTGKDLTSVSDALSKAYNGNFAALKKLDPQLAELVKSGASADQVFGALGKTFEGQASTAANTAAGKMQRFQLALSEAYEEIGARLLPVMTKLSAFAVDTLLPAVDSIIGGLDRFGGWVADNWQIISAAFTGLAIGVGTVLVPAFIAWATTAGAAALATLAAAAPQIQAGKLRALAVISEKRSSLLPKVPGYGELGLSSALFDAWYAVAAPAHLPVHTQNKLLQALHKVMSEPEVQNKLTQQSMEAVVGGPQELKATMDQEVVRYRAIVARANIRIEP